jgi:hypothetical protein
VAPDVRRQWRKPLGAEQRLDRPVEPLDHAHAIRLDRGHPQARAAFAARAQLHADVTAAPGAHERAPAVGRQRLHEQQLDAPAARVLGEDARGDHARVVDDEAVSGAQQLRQLVEHVVGERAARTVDLEQPRRLARLRRHLRDGGGRERVVERVEIHDCVVYRPAQPIFAPGLTSRSGRSRITSPRSL